MYIAPAQLYQPSHIYQAPAFSLQQNAGSKNYIIFLPIYLRAYEIENFLSTSFSCIQSIYVRQFYSIGCFIAYFY